MIKTTSTYTTTTTNIITQLKDGEKGQSLAKEYGFDKATISKSEKYASKIFEVSEEQQN